MIRALLLAVGLVAGILAFVPSVAASCGGDTGTAYVGSCYEPGDDYWGVWVLGEHVVGSQTHCVWNGSFYECYQCWGGLGAYLVCLPD